MIAMLAICTINYIVMYPRIVNDPVWIANITTKCPRKNLDDAFGTRSMTDAGAVGLGFSAYFGLLFHARVFPGLMLRKTTDNHWYTYPLLRVIITFLICVPILCLFAVKADSISNVYALAFMKAYVPTLVSGF